MKRLGIPNFSRFFSSKKDSTGQEAEEERSTSDVADKESDDVEVSDVESSDEEKKKLMKFHSQKSPPKKSNKKKFIIPPVVVAILIGLWASGIIPDFEIIPDNQILLNIGSADERQPEILEKISELEFRLSALEDDVDFLFEEMDSIASTGPAGPQGERGEQGPQGPQGTPGPSGPSMIPMIFSMGERFTQLASDLYLSQGHASEDYNRAKVLLPVTGTIRELRALSSIDAGVPIIVTLVKNGQETSLSCRLEQGTFCEDLSNVVDVKAGDTVAIKVKKTSPLYEAKTIRIQAGIILVPKFG